jgi:transcriptional regulator NrdR family protein
MICPQCGEPLAVIRTLSESNRVVRHRRCRGCKARFESVEQITGEPTSANNARCSMGTLDLASGLLKALRLDDDKGLTRLADSIRFQQRESANQNQH